MSKPVTTDDWEVYFEKKIKCPVNIAEITSKEFRENFDTQANYGIEIWLNDMFAWATSWVFTFVANVESLDEQCAEFEKWLKLEGKAIFDKFALIPLPEYDKEKKIYTPPLELYFKKNCTIGVELGKSIDKYTGMKFEDQWEPLEENANA